ncbi:MAG: chromosomal replication initiator protein DnaA [Bacteroidota bacterium]
MHPDSPHDAWSRCLEIIRDNISRQSFRTWFAPLKAVSLTEEEGLRKLTVQLPSRFYYEWIEEHYFALLRKTVTKVLGPNGRLYYDILIESPQAPGTATPRERGGDSNSAGTTVQLPARPGGAPAPPPNAGVPGVAPPSRPGYPGTPPREPVPPYHQPASPTNPFVIPGIRKPQVDPNLNPGYTFERFIEGDCNRLARSAAWAIAQQPGATSFNPFLIYGGVGLGKTHLIQAIGNHAKLHGHADTVLYVSSEQFTNQFVQAIKDNNASDFSNFYRQIDVLIVDDVQFFSGKEKTQEEFFHIFNALHQAGKQIVLSSDRAPKDIVGIEERLLSRFSWGLAADVQLPELETRTAILRRKAEDDGIRVAPEVIDYIATNVKSNIRELEGSLIRLLAHAALHDREIDLPLAREVLKDLIKDIRITLNVEEIQRITCEFFEIPEDLVRARTRKREVVRARQVAMYFAKQFTEQSLKSIGLQFGGRDHSTVIHAINSVEDQIETDPRFREMISDLRGKLELHTR